MKITLHASVLCQWLRKIVQLLHRERGGSRIPRPSGWGSSEPSHVICAHLNR